jgi:hypothetical protein
VILTDRLYESHWGPLPLVHLLISNSLHSPRVAFALTSSSNAARIDLDERRTPHFSVVGRPPHGDRGKSQTTTERADREED